MEKKRKVFYSLIDIEREYMPKAFQERLKRLKEKTETIETEIPVINDDEEPM